MSRALQPHQTPPGHANTVADYCSYDPFFGDEAERKCRTVAVRKSQITRPCFSLDGKQDHDIKPGDHYRYETARIDGSFWGRYCICLHCMDKFIEGEY